MKTKKAPYQSIDQYISEFPENTQKILEKIRSTIAKAAPKAEEAISYQIPTFKLNGNLVHFAAYKNHIGFYPVPSAIKKFKQELPKFKSSKGAIQFPIDQPMPLGLISKIVKYRVKENLEKISMKDKKDTKDFYSVLAAPAKRALESKNIKTLKQLSKFSEEEILQLHGIGKTVIPKLKEALKAGGLFFKK